MPKIRLKNKTGSYGCGDRNFEAGKEYNVDYNLAYYLVHTAKVAEEVTPLSPLPLPDKLDKDTAESIAPVLHAPEGYLKIAAIRLGGIGDSLILAGLATAIKRKYPKSFITLYIRDKSGADIISGHPDVNRVVQVGNKVWATFVERSILTKDYDIVYDNRYMTKVYYKDHKAFAKDKQITDDIFKQYQDLYDTFPYTNNEIPKTFKLNEYDLMLLSANLVGSPDDMFINMKDRDYDMLALLEGDNYITIHNGADVSRQTKCWSAEHWTKLVSKLKKDGIKVIQLGASCEEPIEGAINMAGRSTIKQTAAFLARAKLHIDSEGGLVHIARAMATRSVVLFGPTSRLFFEYECNVNVEPTTDCKDCWWTTDMWWRECPKGKPYPVPCMNSITPDIVYKAIQKALKQKPMEKIPRYDKSDVNEKFALELVLDEKHYKASPWQYDRIETMMSRVKGQTVLEVGAGDGYCVEVLQKRGYTVTATEVSKIRIERMKKKGIRAQYADVRKLPFPDNSFDTVMCGEVLEHIPSMAEGLKELERVCKPDGRIVVSLPVGDDYQKLKMHLWGIRHHSILRQGALDLIVMEFEQINR